MRRTFRVVLAVELDDQEPPLTDKEAFNRDSPEWVEAKRQAEAYVGGWIEHNMTQVIDQSNAQDMTVTVTDCEETTA